MVAEKGWSTHSLSATDSGTGGANETLRFLRALGLAAIVLDLEACPVSFNPDLMRCRQAVMRKLGEASFFMFFF
jgi:hypothetical protein